MDTFKDKITFDRMEAQGNCPWMLWRSVATDSRRSRPVAALPRGAFGRSRDRLRWYGARAPGPPSPDRGYVGRAGRARTARGRGPDERREISVQGANVAENGRKVPGRLPVDPPPWTERLIRTLEAPWEA